MPAFHSTTPLRQASQLKYWDSEGTVAHYSYDHRPGCRRQISVLDIGARADPITPVAEVMATPYGSCSEAAIGENHCILLGRSEVQTQELQAMNFNEVWRFSNTSGTELLTDQYGQHPRVSWVYYFCRKP